MCRNIKTLFNFDPPATKVEIDAASEQYVRKVSGFAHPSHANEKAYQQAIDDVAAATYKLMHSMKTDAKPHNRAEEAKKAHARAVARFGAHQH